MKKLSLAILLIATLVMTVSTSVTARTPDTYTWDVEQPGAFIWEITNGWMPTDLANTGLWPTIAGDAAVFSPPNTQTQSLGNFQVWLTSDKTIGDMTISITNEQINITESGSPLLVFDNPSNDTSSIVFTNARPVLADGSINDLAMIFWDTTKLILSNDLIIAGITPDNVSNAVGFTEFLLYDSTMIFGNGHDITFNGGGWFTPGWFGDSVAIQGANKVVNNGGLLRQFESPTFDSPLYVNSYYDCNNDQSRGTYAMAGENFDMDLVLTNAYVESYYSNWLKRYLTGTMVVRDFVLMNVYDTTGGTELIWTNVVQSIVSGDGIFYKGYNNEISGFVEFTGEIAPGEGGNGSLHFFSPMGDRVSFGLPGDRLDLTLGVNGMRNYFGIDNDTLIADNISGIDLGNMDLTISMPKGSQTNPYRTNELMYSYDNAFVGGFNSVTWSNPGRTGELIVTPEAVLVTGITPLSNFFDVYDDRVVLVKGETQQVLFARSPFEIDVNAVADESWISVQPVISLSNDVSVSVPVTVPADQPTTNGYGLSSGTITFSSAADPSVKIEEDVFVLEPGYFELNKSKLWFMTDVADSASVRAYSPLTVGVQATIEDGSSWISIDGDSSVYLTNSGKNVDFDVTAQPVGTTGLLSFTNIDTPSVKHDVPVEVVGPGFFEVAPTTIEFVTGQTQKFINVSAPFVTGVNISSVDPWIAVPSSVSLDGNGYSIPVVIPVDQAAGTGTISFVSTCSTNYSYDVNVIVSSPCGDFTINTNLLEFITGIDTQKFVTLTSDGCATVDIQPISSSWITVTNSIYLLNSTTDVAITIPIDQADGSTGVVRFTSVELPMVTYDVEVIVVPEPFIIISLLLAIGALAFHRS